MSDQKPRVLVVDDEPAVLRVTARVVRSLGFEAMEAVSLSEAIRLAVADPPSVALLDLHLGDASGLTVAQRMRAEAPGVPMVFTTGGIEGALEDMLAAYGTLLGKPFDREALRAALQEAVDQGSRPT